VKAAHDEAAASAARLLSITRSRLRASRGWEETFLQDRQFGRNSPRAARRACRARLRGAVLVVAASRQLHTCLPPRWPPRARPTMSRCRATPVCLPLITCDMTRPPAPAPEGSVHGARTRAAASAPRCVERAEAASDATQCTAVVLPTLSRQRRLGGRRRPALHFTVFPRCCAPTTTTSFVCDLKQQGRVVYEFQ
jgi:hypothetical protein